jgi:hypothetical protein
MHNLVSAQGVWTLASGLAGTCKGYCSYALAIHRTLQCGKAQPLNCTAFSVDPQQS